MSEQTTSQSSKGPIGIGIDFGTSNSSIALFDGETVKTVTFHCKGEERDHMPTAIYLNKELMPIVGFEALDTFLKDNAGRRIELVKEEVGNFQMSVAGTEKAGTKADAEGITVDVNAHAWTDLNLPGRLFRGVKSWLGEAEIERVKVFDRKLRTVALVTPILESFKKHCKRSNPYQAIHLGRPVNFEGSSEKASEVALSRLKEASEYAGLSPTCFYLEPVAAILSFLKARRPQPGEHFLCFDFGGGTLDLCIVETTADGFEILATEGTGLGGDAIDRLIFEKKLFPEFGKGLKVPRRNRPDELAEFRFQDYAELLLNWPNAYQLNTRELREQILQGMRIGGEGEKKLNRLRSLILNNLSYQLFQAVEAAKVRLSNEEETTIEFPELNLNVRFTREELNSYLDEPLQRIEKVVTSILEKSKLPTEKIDAIVCTGGSSRIPIVQSKLTEIIGRPILEHDAFTGIATGLAIANYLGYE